MPAGAAAAAEGGPVPVASRWKRRARPGDAAEDAEEVACSPDCDPIAEVPSTSDSANIGGAPSASAHVPASADFEPSVSASAALARVLDKQTPQRTAEAEPASELSIGEAGTSALGATDAAIAGQPDMTPEQLACYRREQHAKLLQFQAQQAAAAAAAGTIAHPKPAKRLPPAGFAHRSWWHALEGECCPISLTPIEELKHEPFGLLGVSDGGTAPKEGLWGAAGAAALKRGQAVHWFDGAFLSSFLVSGSSLIDPVNRRSLSRGECVSLDAFLAAHRLPAVHVTDAYDLLRNTSAKSGGSGDPGRMGALEREAASLLQSLFAFRGSGSSGAARSAATRPAQPAGRSRPGPATGLSQGSARASGTAVGDDAAGATEMSESSNDKTTKSCPKPQHSSFVPPTRAPVSSQGLATQRTLHRDGGLRVVDDGEFEDEDQNATTSYGADDAPTPAEASSKAAAGPPRGLRAPVPRARGRGSSQKSPADCGSRGRNLPNPTLPRIAAPIEEWTADVLPVGEEFEINAASAERDLLLCDVHVPDWAHCGLHERTLDELQVVEAMFPDEFELLTTAVREHLEACVAEGSVSSRAEALCFQVMQQVGQIGTDGSVPLVIEFTLPPYYPSHSAMVELSFPEACNCSRQTQEALSRLEAAIRTEVLREMQGSEVVLGVIDWLTERALTELIDNLPQLGTETVVAPMERGAMMPEVLETVATKSERIDQARAERLQDKYSESWDLCYAFVQLGTCKEGKSCRWRHAVPGKDKR